MENQDIENRFKYHKPNNNTLDMHKDIRYNFLNLAKVLNDMLPEGREKSLAITKLEEGLFWSNASIARNLSEIDIES